MTYKVITSGFESGHNFDKGDKVVLTRENYPCPGLNMYERQDGLKQALDKNDIEELKND